MSMKNSNDAIGKRTHDLSACSKVTQPTALPRAPLSSCVIATFVRVKVYRWTEADNGHFVFYNYVILNQNCRLKQLVRRSNRFLQTITIKSRDNGKGLGQRSGRVHLKPDGTRWRTEGEMKGKLTNGVGSQYSHTTSERGVSSITNADALTSAASSRLNWRPRRFKWTRPFRRKTKSGFSACAITFQTQSTWRYSSPWCVGGQCSSVEVELVWNLMAHA